MFFDIKMDSDFTRKSRLVAGGHKTALQLSITISSAVTRDIFRLGFIIAGLNNLDICDWDIGNAHLNCTCWEKLCTKEGSYFGIEKEYVFLISRALYGLNFSGAACIAKLAETLNSMDYRYTKSEPDVWIKRATSYNITAYYKYMLVYFDDVLHLAKDAQKNICWILTIFIDLRKVSGHQIDISGPTSIKSN